jgi:hypothetical protein
MGNVTTPALGAIPSAVPCRISKTAPREFQVKAGDMPVKIQLCDAPGKVATKCNLNTVSVFAAGSEAAVSGQPSGVTNTDFTISLQSGTFDVVIGVDVLPGCKDVLIFEACANQVTPMGTIVPDVQETISFELEVT